MGSANPPATRPRRNSVMVGVAPAGREVISAGPASCQTPSVRRCQKGLCRVFSEPEGPNSCSSFPSLSAGEFHQRRFAAQQAPEREQHQQRLMHRAPVPLLPHANAVERSQDFVAGHGQYFAFCGST